jgi:hypothetical protein
MRTGGGGGEDEGWGGRGLGLGGRWYHTPMLLGSAEVKLIFCALRKRELLHRL